MNDNNYEARASDVDLERITSSTHNALILEKLRSNDDEFTTLGIAGVDHNWADEEDFIVKEGDNLGWLGYFIGKSKQLGSLWVFYLPVDDSFRQGPRSKSVNSRASYLQRPRRGRFPKFSPFLP